MLDECLTSTGGATIPERLRGISGASDGRRRGELWEKGHTDETEAWSQERQSGSTSAADAGAETILTFYTIAETIKSIDVNDEKLQLIHVNIFSLSLLINLLIYIWCIQSDSAVWH